MVYELRVYTCIPGRVQQVIEMWEEEGRSMIEPYMQMVGQWIGESGNSNQIYTLWSFRDMNHRQEAREALMKHEGFSDYLARCRACYVEQVSTFLSPTSLSPLQ